MLCPGVLSGGGKEVVVTEVRVGLLVFGFFHASGNEAGEMFSLLLLHSRRKFNLCWFLAFVVPMGVCFHHV